jgi:hypothetical protein
VVLAVVGHHVSVAEVVMTVDRLRDVLAGDGGLALVSLDGERAEGTYVLEHRGNGWLVFFWGERGGKRDFEKHSSEDAACRDLLARLGR